MLQTYPGNCFTNLLLKFNIHKLNIDFFPMKDNLSVVEDKLNTKFKEKLNCYANVCLS